jgi:hypothetical protein
MRTSSPALRAKPTRFAAGLTGYLAMAAFLITLLTSTGTWAVATGSLTFGLLASSYLLDRWARRQTVRSRPSPTGLADVGVARTEHVTQGSGADKSRVTYV